MKEEELYMQRALELAVLGQGKVSPNPMVGCVIVWQGQILAEGYHQKFGQNHAEVQALNQIKDKTKLTQSVVYTNLEPCSHYGKTPPCAKRLIEEKVAKVVVGCHDPNPKVAGKGIAMLREAGIDVEVGVLEQQAIKLNERFFVNQQFSRPWVLLKWAQTSDGFIARKDYRSKWISGLWSRRLSHKWRAQEDAILVGTTTAIYDSPLLNVRLWPGRNPLRVILDRQGIVKINESDGQTMVLGKTNSTYQAVELIDFSPTTILTQLHELNIGSVIIEGGAKLIQSFIDENLWDKACVFVGAKQFGEGITAPKLKNAQIVDKQIIKPDQLLVFQNWHSFRKVYK